VGDVRRAERRSVSEYIFAALVRVFPCAFRGTFGDDMRDLFRDQHRAARARGRS
jgi:hypothetical protein